MPMRVGVPRSDIAGCTVNVSVNTGWHWACECRFQTIDSGTVSTGGGVTHRGQWAHRYKYLWMAGWASVCACRRGQAWQWACEYVCVDCRIAVGMVMKVTEEDRWGQLACEQR